VKNGAGISFEYSSSVSEAYGAAPLLCHVSKTYSSLFVLVLSHFLHFTVMLSIHGLCNSKSGPSGKFSAASTISFLVKNQFFSLHSSQFQTGNGHPQILSREIHHGCLSLMIPKNRFFGCSKKYSTLFAASIALLSSLSNL